MTFFIKILPDSGLICVSAFRTRTVLKKHNGGKPAPGFAPSRVHAVDYGSLGNHVPGEKTPSRRHQPGVPNDKSLGWDHQGAASLSGIQADTHFLNCPKTRSRNAVRAGSRMRRVTLLVSRREFLSNLGAVGAAAGLMGSEYAGAEPLLSPLQLRAAGRNCPFRLSVINDEISQDFDHACSVAARDFGPEWIELRGMWNKNISDLDSAEVDRSRKILEKYGLRVTDIASPLFKTDWPGAPQSKESPKRDQFHADFDFKQQDQVLERCIALAKSFAADRIRCFDFWRLDDQKPYREAINEKLRQAARTCAKHDLILLLENEMSCNTATGEEGAATLAAVTEPNFMLNWDPGNAATFPGNTPYPNGYDLLPKNRIGHCHCKDVKRDPGGKWEWAPVGAGVVDWVGQFRAFVRDGYHYAVSLETHWRGGGTPEESSRISMKGLKEALAKAGTGC